MFLSEEGSTGASRRNDRRFPADRGLAAAAFDPGNSLATRQLTGSDEAGGAALTYDTPDGVVPTTTENLDWTSTAQLWFSVPSTARSDGRAEQLAVTVDLEHATTPSLSSWDGTATLELALAETLR